jgi:hypothetical protein
MDERDRKRRPYSSPQLSHVELKPEESLSVGCKQDWGTPATEYNLSGNGCLEAPCFDQPGS